MAYIYNSDVNTPEAIAMKLNDVVVAAIAYMTAVDEATGVAAARTAMLVAVNAAVSPNFGDPAPVAAFSGTPLTGNEPLTVTFTDESTGIINSVLWEYKLAAASEWTEMVLVSDDFEFEADGTYDVRLTVANDFGSDVETKEDYVVVAVV